MKILSLMLEQLENIFKGTLKSLFAIYSSNLYWLVAILFTNFATYLQNTFLFDWFMIEKIIWLLIIDTVLGLCKAIKNQNVDLKIFSGFFIKVIVYAVFISAISLLKGVSLLEYLIPYLLSGIITHEILSIIKNIAILKPKLIPVWIRRVFTEFDVKGVFKNDPDALKSRKPKADQSTDNKTNNK